MDTLLQNGFEEGAELFVVGGGAWSPGSGQCQVGVACHNARDLANASGHEYFIEPSSRRPCQLPALPTRGCRLAELQI